MSDVLKTETHDGREYVLAVKSNTLIVIDDRRIAFILSSPNDLLPDEREALVVLLNQRRFDAPEIANGATNES